MDAYNEDRPKKFYIKCGFEFLYPTEEEEKSAKGLSDKEPLLTRSMFFDLIVLRKSAQAD